MDYAALAKQYGGTTGAPDYELLYPYCHSTNDPLSVAFAVDIPALFLVGNGLEKIVSQFDGVDGENHRVVFWFDN